MEKAIGEHNKSPQALWGPQSKVRRIFGLMLALQHSEAEGAVSPGSFGNLSWKRFNRTLVRGVATDGCETVEFETMGRFPGLMLAGGFCSVWAEGHNKVHHPHVLGRFFSSFDVQKGRCMSERPPLQIVQFLVIFLGRKNIKEADLPFLPISWFSEKWVYLQYLDVPGS